MKIILAQNPLHRAQHQALGFSSNSMLRRRSVETNLNLEIIIFVIDSAAIWMKFIQTSNFVLQVDSLDGNLSGLTIARRVQMTKVRPYTAQKVTKVLNQMDVFIRSHSTQGPCIVCYINYS